MRKRVRTRVNAIFSGEDGMWCIHDQVGGPGNNSSEHIPAWRGERSEPQKKPESPALAGRSGWYIMNLSLASTDSPRI
ncbi:hypothetical protein Y032_0010g1045 [Ancylostoma ceylanicum]|uniref:Uncharacterized protein n=1 Tax=Ancylostoma ceylanicum TaxID=53326 RepID=A0A016VGU8_9BILA|nr:hypothetical protein Y032_0010g1045 [Ancylostoma ceylanicum]